MAKAETFGKPAVSKDGTGTSFKDYTSLLGVVAAGFLGISLLCITSAIALSAPNAPTPLALEPASIVDLAVNNINTVSALTVQALDISIEETPILLPSRTPTSTSSPTISPIFPSATQKQPTKTRGPRTPSTATPKPPPTNTAVPPSKTPLPPPTNTPIPPDTNTPIPPTVTPDPPTATNEPPTATNEPPTATNEPPTATNEPPTATNEPPTPEPPTATLGAAP